MKEIQSLSSHRKSVGHQIWYHKFTLWLQLAVSLTQATAAGIPSVDLIAIHKTMNYYRKKFSLYFATSTKYFLIYTQTYITFSGDTLYNYIYIIYFYRANQRQAFQ